LIFPGSGGLSVENKAFSRSADKGGIAVTKFNNTHHQSKCPRHKHKSIPRDISRNKTNNVRNGLAKA
jgi:hypothetical protein